MKNRQIADLFGEIASLLTIKGENPFRIRAYQRAAARGVAMEINAHPARLDLSAQHVRMAKQQGVPLVISTDAHTNGDFDYMEYGVATARRGWAVPGDVLNTRPCAGLLKRLRSGRNRDVPSLGRKT